MQIEQLTILYDSDCGFCARCRAWLQQNEGQVALEFIARDSPEVARRFPDLEPNIADELLVIDDHGGVYRGPDAFIMCLYALEAYRGWALRLAAPGIKHLARSGFELVSSQRHRINDWLSLKSDRALATELARAVGTGAPRCAR
jgi:predicted DCC family thiol-disulfide oxidoreductase YuxK